MSSTSTKRKRGKVYKGGRPRKTHPSVDLGTPELAAKRASLSADQTLSTCPLDLALAKGVIDQETHAACGYFAACRALVYGSPHPRALDLLRVSGSNLIPNASEAEARYRDACGALSARGRSILDAAENFIVHERFPRWLLASDQTRASERALEAFAVLVDWYSGRCRRRAA
jgi:hypothetical protein